MAKKHIWYLKAIIKTPATVWVTGETEEEARERFRRGSWYKVVPHTDHCTEFNLREDLDYAVVKGPGTNK
jgi:hypothetical protein